MKSIAATFATLLMTAPSALAADAIAPASYYDGFYVGLQGGAASNSSTTNCAPYNLCNDIDMDTSLNNTFAGGYAGYNMSFDSFVLGIEGDINAAFGSDSFYWEDWAAETNGYSITQDYFGTVRGRIGFLATDQLMIFGTGGVAFTNYKLDNDGCPDCSAWGSTTVIDSTNTGWVAGVGAEYALSEAAHIKLEYLHSDFGDDTLDHCDGSDCASFKTALTNDQVRVGISWNFGM